MSSEHDIVVKCQKKRLAMREETSGTAKVGTANFRSIGRTLPRHGLLGATLETALKNE